MTKPMIAIPLGDPGGIGPEVTLKALIEGNRSSECHTCVIGSRHVLSLLKEKLGLSHNFLVIRDPKDLDGASSQATFLDISEESDSEIQIGQISAANGKIALRTLEVAAKLALEGKVQAIVTAPLHKTAVRHHHKNFRGHTDFLAETANIKKYAMMFVSPKLKVTLATIHIALKKVSEDLTSDGIYDKIILTEGFLSKYLKQSKPHLGVCALNPHGKETGTEEEAIIAPAVFKAQKEGVNVDGPFFGGSAFL